MKLKYFVHRRLTSHYDVFATMSHVLQSYPLVSESIQKSATLGKSLFSNEIPMDRSCESAGIPERFCVCILPKELPTTDPNLLLAAEETTKTLNEHLALAANGRCAHLRVSKITAGATLSNKQAKKNIFYIVDFIAEPGNILIEAHVEYTVSSKVFSSSPDVSRLNRMVGDFSCITDSKLEKFCSCL